MCLYPKLIKNRKYLPNKKNKGMPPIPTDSRTMYVPIGCQKCMECRKQKQRQWAVRLQEEIRTNKTGQYVTLTFSNESIKELNDIIQKENIENVDKETGEILELTGYALDNQIATVAVRRFLERWRKKHGVSVKHWLITELGQGKDWKYQGTENLHLHGIIFSNERADIINIWKYGWVFLGSYVNESTINYTTKYVTKIDPKHKHYNPKILTSPGMGEGYTKRIDAKLNKYVPRETKETYTTRQGIKLNLPIYYRNKLYSEKEREELWIEKLDKQIRWVDGQKIDISKGDKEYLGILKIAQTKNKRLGYGDDKVNWKQKEYEENMRKINIQKRLDKTK